jgi:hypothetical protein
MTLQEIAHRERQELERVNELARQLADCRADSMDAGGLDRERLRPLQERHALHLDRLLRLRLRLRPSAGADDDGLPGAMSPAVAAV